MEIKCKNCGLAPDQIDEYIDIADEEEMSPEEYVISEEGTYNPTTGRFYCTDCYIKVGEPLGTA